MCQIFCDETFTFAESTPNVFTCVDGEWSPEMLLPECINKSLLGDNDISETRAVYFPTDNIPDDMSPVCLTWSGNHYKAEFENNSSKILVHRTVVNIHLIKVY